MKGGDVMKTITAEICSGCRFETACIVDALFERFPTARGVVFDGGCPADLEDQAQADLDADEKKMTMTTAVREI
jgi:hypothetical protein